MFLPFVIWLSRCVLCASTAEQQGGAGLDSPAGRSGPSLCTAGSPLVQCPGPVYRYTGRRSDRQRADFTLLTHQHVSIATNSMSLTSRSQLYFKSLPQIEGDGTESSQCQLPCSLKRYEGDHVAWCNL